ncbi:MAG: HlyD family efflux transporter periplasmic adaptor subunit [Planctomycetota bacterium]
MARNRLRRVAPVAVWLTAVAAVIALGSTRPSRDALPALAHSPTATLCAPVGGRLATMTRSLHDVVQAGEIVGRLDDGDVRLRLQQARFELERLRADVELEQRDRSLEASTVAAEHELESSTEYRRLSSTVETAQLAALGTRTQLEEARVRVVGASIEVERQRELSQQGIVDQTLMVRLETEQKALQKRISELEALLEEHHLRVETAKQRLDAFRPTDISLPDLEAALAPRRWRLKEQEAAIERIVKDAERLDLTAPISGRITAVMRRAGEWVEGGAALLTIVAPTPDLLRAYQPEHVLAPLQPSQRVEVRRSDNHRLGEAVVLGVSPAIVRIPERLWRMPQQEEWGYEVLLSATAGALPGERLLITPLP